MQRFVAELRSIHDQLRSVLDAAGTPSVADSLSSLDSSATEVQKAWSGSWLGYHSRVYYRNFQPPPAGANFSSEWGLEEVWGINGTTGNWEEYTADHIRSTIERRAGAPDLSEARRVSSVCQEAFDDKRADVLSILESCLSQQPDPILQEVRDEVRKLKVIRADEYVEYVRPSGTLMSRDSLAVSQGIQVPPHVAVQAEVFHLRSPITMCRNLDKLALRIISHLTRATPEVWREVRVGTNVFIGHGQSPLWKDLKDFIQNRLHLPWDEFNRVPIAGLTTIARLAEMLDSAAIAFLVMTAEDERTDGSMQARLNVVHEAGLFQGRLGFSKAIILLEEGCAEFSNIDGLGQIRFPKGKISAVFEEVRRVLERERIIES